MCSCLLGFDVPLSQPHQTPHSFSLSDLRHHFSFPHALSLPWARFHSCLSPIAASFSELGCWRMTPPPPYESPWALFFIFSSYYVSWQRVEVSPNAKIQSQWLLFSILSPLQRPSASWPILFLLLRSRNNGDYNRGKLSCRFFLVAEESKRPFPREPLFAPAGARFVFEPRTRQPFQRSRECLVLHFSI